jgi:outer membrane lipoprotein SlyB
MRMATAALAIVFVVSGCSTATKDVYDASDVGRVISTSEATVVASRTVKITEQPHGYGPLGGTAAGAAAGGLTIGSGSGSGVAALLGGLLGAGVGYLAEQSARSREGIEYLVRTQDGRVQTLVQNRGPSEQPIPPGTPVLVQVGGAYTRVIEKPEGAEEQWKNPDTPASTDPRASPGSGTGGASGSSGPAGTAGQPTPLPSAPSPTRSSGQTGVPSQYPAGSYGTGRPKQQ